MAETVQARDLALLEAFEQRFNPSDGPAWLPSERVRTDDQRAGAIFRSIGFDGAKLAGGRSGTMALAVLGMEHPRAGEDRGCYQQ